MEGDMAEDSESDLPIVHVTNGVHIPSYSQRLAEEFDPICAPVD
jgi:hypothetical protein